MVRSLLHVGAGSGRLPEWLSDYKETRLDIDHRHNPDIIANMTDLGDIGEFDVVYSSHCLEHLHDYDVIKALQEFNRVLKKGGFLMVFVPDLEDVKPDETVLFTSPSGDITGMDLIYGLRKALKHNPFMAHKTGFNKTSLRNALSEFDKVEVKRLDPYNLMGVGVK